MCKSNVAKRYFVHRLVALAFIPNPDNKPQVNHIDGDKSNNCVTNLEWVTAQENITHSWVNGLAPSGSKHGLSKLKEVDVPNIRQMALDGMSQRKIGLVYGVSHITIWHLLSGKTWKHVM